MSGERSGLATRHDTQKLTEQYVVPDPKSVIHNIKRNILNVSGEVVTLKTGDINVHQTPILSYLQSSLSCLTLASVM